MSEPGQNHDDMLFQLLQECKTLPKFFDNVFGFLQRRTDFYHIANEPNAPVGLPEGFAEKIVKHTFYKWKPQPLKPMYTKEETTIGDCKKIENIFPTKDESDSGDGKKIENTSSPYFTNSECYNGSRFDSYCWSQTILDVDITIRLPDDSDKKKLVVSIQPTHVLVKLKDNVLLEGELCQKCKANDAIWSLDGEKLAIHLDKCQDMWWNCFVKSEVLLDISKIDCTRPYEDLPEEAQVKIQELQWNQERKQLGLPTSEELLLQEKLKKCWDAKGSPFSGPFDPDAVSLQ